MEHIDYDIDNRDIYTTKLHFENGDSVEVDVRELIVNVIENSGLSDEKEIKLLNMVNEIYYELLLG
jgi:hypothetical protein